MRKGIAILLLTMLTMTASAQTAPEYRFELGAGAGLVTYLGDFNGNITKNAQPMFSLVAKYRLDPRMALGFNVSYGKIKGASKDAKTHIPAQWQDYSFNHALWDAGLRFEYNFWPYGTGMEYRGAKRLTPYIYIGVGLSVAKPQKTEAAMNLPIGGGVKYKVADRVNMALEWTMHFTTSDWLDGVKDPYGIESSGLFKNTDCYSHLRLSVTYDLWAKCKTCHNDKD